MEKVDLRIKKSKNALQKSFVQLLSEKSFSKITVEEICKLANVNRMTFYNHYHDKYDLFNDLIEKIRETITLRILDYAKGDFSIENIPNLLFKISEIVINQCTVYRDIILSLNNDDSTLIQYIISHSLSDSIAKVMSSIITKEDISNKIPLLSIFLTGGISSLIVHWLENEKDYKREELNILIKELIAHTYQILIS